MMMMMSYVSKEIHTRQCICTVFITFIFSYLLFYHTTRTHSSVSLLYYVVYTYNIMYKDSVRFHNILVTSFNKRTHLFTYK